MTGWKSLEDVEPGNGVKFQYHERIGGQVLPARPDTSRELAEPGAGGSSAAKEV
jgi:hypothetical protein